MEKTKESPIEFYEYNTYSNAFKLFLQTVTIKSSNRILSLIKKIRTPLLWLKAGFSQITVKKTCLVETHIKFDQWNCQDELLLVGSSQDLK